MTVYGEARVSADGQTLDSSVRVRAHGICALLGEALPSPAPAKPAIDAETERAARAFLRRLEGKFPVVE
ncbi:MAG: hypothetical protein JOZ17_22675, partial [Acetobacteraceae bacterium]|nr:hypothetical protein [Acetobacteraceae bacterium]